MINRITAGDSVEYGMNVADYPPADGWTLKQRLVPRFSSPVMAPVTLTATPDGTVDGTAFDYVITATPAATAAWAAGAYGWHTWVEKTGARVTLEGTQYAGELTVLPDPATITQGTDTRSAARKALDDALAAQRSYLASNGAVAEYSIGDRRMKFHAAADIAALITRLRVDVAREQRGEAIAKGLADPRKIFVRAGRA